MLNARFCTAVFVFGAVISSCGYAADRPNFLIIMADDCTFNDLPLYGGRNARTPNIDRLAQEGLTFNRAYLCSAMCQPCRAELFTGQYPMRNGCAWNHSASRPGTQSMPHYLKPMGYRVGIAGKVHVKPKPAFPFENVAGFDANCVRLPTQPHSLDGVREFITRDSKQPFCLVVALVEPHIPWVMGDAGQYPPEKLQLPPNVGDNKRTREEFSRYLAEVTYMDSQVGEILDTLALAGAADNTLVLFTSEQGSQMPGNKWTNWDTGVHTALVARLPGVVPAGQRTDAIVQYNDILPTLLDLAGDSAPKNNLDGSGFAEVLKGHADTHREFVYFMHNNEPEGPSYPVRAVSDGTYRYIRNLSPNELYIEHHLMGSKADGRHDNPYWSSWMWDSQARPDIYRLIRRYMLRPAEELYHTTEDPYEQDNLLLTNSEEHEEVRARLAAALEEWMAAQGDPGVPQDSMDALRAARQGKHLYGPTTVSE